MAMTLCDVQCADSCFGRRCQEPMNLVRCMASTTSHTLKDTHLQARGTRATRRTVRYTVRTPEGGSSSWSAIGRPAGCWMLGAPQGFSWMRLLAEAGSPKELTCRAR